MKLSAISTLRATVSTGTCKRFQGLLCSSEYDLVNCFNIETSHNGWVGRRGCYIKALVQAMQEKKIDVSEITTVENGYHAVHLKYPVFYRERDRKVVQIRQEWLKTKF